MFTEVQIQYLKDQPNLLAKKIFKLSNPEVIAREEYKSDGQQDWWNTWPKLSFQVASHLKSKIDPEKVYKMALDHKFPDHDKLRMALNDLKTGADIGVREERKAGASEASTSTNAPSSYEFGDRVTDSIVTWIKQGYCMGPFFSLDETPWKEDLCVNGLMVKLKPNGKARVILNLSAGSPCPVNEGIDKKDFPAIMSSTKAWIRILYSTGRNAWICKSDWSSAYKQIRV